jgi:hypothetical protein
MMFKSIVYGGFYGKLNQFIYSVRYGFCPSVEEMKRGLNENEE